MNSCELCAGETSLALPLVVTELNCCNAPSLKTCVSERYFCVVATVKLNGEDDTG